LQVNQANTAVTRTSTFSTRLLTFLLTLSSANISLWLNPKLTPV